MKKNLFLLVALTLSCALILSATSLLTEKKILQNQKAEIETTLTLLFPSGKDLARKEESTSLQGVSHFYRFTDSKGDTAALAVVLTAKDSHSNTFLLVVKKDGSLIGIRPLLTFGAHAFPNGAYNEELLDSYRGEKAPFAFEEGLEGSEHLHTLKSLSAEVNKILSRLKTEGEIK